MNPRTLIAVPLFVLAGCGHRYTIVGESDTNKPIAVSIMKTAPGEPVQLYFTELTGNDTEFIWDRRIYDKDAQIEAWFELKERPGRPTVYAVPPDHHIRLKLDRDGDRVFVEQTRIDGKIHQGDD